MKKYTFNFAKLLVLVIIGGLFISGCATTFETTSDDVEITVSSSMTSNEGEITIPPDAHKAGAKIDQLTLEYEAVNLSSSPTTAKMYISLKEVPTVESDRITVLGLILNSNQTKNDEFTPAMLDEAVKQDKFTVGIERTGEPSNLKLTVRLKIVGSIDMFASLIGH